MARGKDYTTTELAEIKGYLNDGRNYEEIAELMGRSKKSIENTVLRQGWTRGRFKDDNPNSQQWSKILENQTEPSIRFPEQTSEEPNKTTIVVTDEVKQIVSEMKNAIKPVKEKTLDDFTPREIIKHMYKIGYRLRDPKNNLYCLQEHVINCLDIINEK